MATQLDRKKLEELAAKIRDYKPEPYKALSTLEVLEMRTQAQAEQRLQRAMAEHQPKVAMPLAIHKAVAGADPLTLDVEMVLLPLDKPNKNKQLVPASEKDNIVRSAKFKPIRASFDGDQVYGHAGAKEIGVITDVWSADSIIYATGAIWLERNEELEQYLQSSSDHGGSFELYYARSEMHSDIEYLYDTVFASQALVKTPAYGASTPVKVKR